MGIAEKIQAYNAQLVCRGLLRTRTVADDGLVSFESNDYLSLRNNAQIAEAYQQGYKLFPAGSGGSMFLAGYHSCHQDLEQTFAQLLEVDACIIFSSGYAANLAVTALLGAIDAHCLIDKGIHASVYDGLALSGVSFSRYRHNDVNDLTRKLTQSGADAVMTEGIFSMSGQIAPLLTISALCNMNNAMLIVDEAHSYGVLGENGKGCVASWGLSQNDVPLRIIPFGKALAGQGALVAGRIDLIEALLQAGRSLIYSTALSPALCYGLLKTVELVAAADERREKLNSLVCHFKEQIASSPLKWTISNTPIQQLQLGCPHKAMRYAQALRTKGFGCSPIRTPTVRVPETGLRLILNYTHQPEQINELFKQLHILHERQYL